MTQKALRARMAEAWEAPATGRGDGEGKSLLATAGR